MTKGKVRKLIDRCRRSMGTCIEAGNEYDFDSYNILVSVIDDDWEYGYGDYTFRYGTADEFFSKAEKDIIKHPNFDEARSVSVDIAYFDKGCPEDEERIEYEEV